MNSTEALICLNMFTGIGSSRLKKLLEFFGRPENIFKASREKLATACGIQQDVAAGIASFRMEALTRELALIKKLNLTVLTPEDDNYPNNLRLISSEPIVLYVKGKILPEDDNSIAIVGSRRASFYGLNWAEKFAVDLAGRGFTIVSGMARGVDTAAHKGALKQSGRTLAVIGSGIARLYPPENQELAEEIARRGAVISEFPVEAEPLAQNFPRRNRLISGLSRGVLVAEAEVNSGALITADFALQQNREVFALPGKIDSLNSSGTNNLIKQGAKLVSCVEDITEEFDPYLTGPNTSIKPQQWRVNDFRLNEEEVVLYGMLDKKQPACFDEIIEKTSMGIPLLSRTIFSLETKRLIRQLPGKQLVRVD